MRHFMILLSALAMIGGAGPFDAAAQNLATDDRIIKQIWEEGNDRSQVYSLAQTLLDSIGPRLTGTPGQEAAGDWVVRMYRSWGVEAANEVYGNWRGWRRGITHVDLMQPWTRSLEGMMLAWSPGSGGPVEGQAVILPNFADAVALNAFLPSVRGKFVLISFAQPTCRTDGNWEEYATAASFSRMRQERTAANQAWDSNIQRTGLNAAQLTRRLEESGAVGIITSRWSNGWGVNKIFGASSERVPTIDLSCEDYGLVFRLAENGQGPLMRVNADAEFLGEVPVANTIARIPGREKPDEYVVLSAHFDSWDGGTGATDNGTGTVTMMEALRILRKVYPNPRRTIIVGHWNGEEQGLNGSRAFVNDNPDVLAGLQALFNQDNGTGRVVNISMQGLPGAGSHFARWLSQIPNEITQHISLALPGMPSGGGSDHASFVSCGAPGFSLSSTSWDYGTYTWHTNRDTFDKIAIDEVRNNAILTAMLVYLASEDPEMISRERRIMPVNASGQQVEWPTCRDGARSFR